MRHVPLTLVATLTVALSYVCAAHGQTSAVRVAGTWNVHIEHYTGRIVDEQWVLRQDGSAVRGTVLVRDQKYPIEGTVEGDRINFRVTVSTADGARYNVFLGSVKDQRIQGDIKKENDDGRFTAVRAAE